MVKRVSKGGLAHVFFILIALIVASIVAVIWALIDLVTRSKEDFEAVKSSKTLWITLVVIGTLLGGIVGLALAIVYLVTVRPRLLRHKVSKQDA